MRHIRKAVAAITVSLVLAGAYAANTFNVLNKPNTVTDPVSIAMGRDPNATLVTAFGYTVNTAGNVTNINNWEAAIAWVPLTTAQHMEIVSSSASDSAAGTGTQSVVVQCLDGNYKQIQEVDTLNGTTAVPMVSQCMIINNVIEATYGSSGVNAGNITVRVAGGGSTQGYIAAGAGMSHHGRFTVPAGYTWIIHNIFLQSNKAGNATASADITAVFLLPDGIGKLQGLPETVGNSTNPTITIPSSIAVGEKTTLEFIINSVSVAGLNIGTGCSGYLIKNQ